MLDDIPEAKREIQPQVTAAEPHGRLWSVSLLTMGAIALLGLGITAATRLITSTASPPIAAETGEETSNSGNSAASSTTSANLNTPANAATPDGDDLLGHRAYPEAPEGELEPLTADGIRLRSTAAAQFKLLQDEAWAAGINIAPVSGFRSIADQQQLFFDVKAERAQTVATRAEVSAPPGYSEHHTGYAIDVVDVDYPETNLEISFEETPAFVWMQANAARYGFELSFPENNEQGVSYEPWHWRFVGDLDSLETFYKESSSVSNIESASPSAGDLESFEESGDREN